MKWYFALLIFAVSLAFNIVTMFILWQWTKPKNKKENKKGEKTK